MSTGPDRNPRGVRVRQRNAAGEVVPEPQHEDSPTALFAQTFAVIANGLHALPENLVEAVRALPERFFLPPWIGRGLRGRKRHGIVGLMNALRWAEQCYQTDPAAAGERVARSIAMYMAAGSEPSWTMSAATGRRLLDRLVANRLAEVAAPSTGEEP